jgi:hypothetical protein
VGDQREAGTVPLNGFSQASLLLRQGRQPLPEASLGLALIMQECQLSGSLLLEPCWRIGRRYIHWLVFCHLPTPRILTHV